MQIIVTVICCLIPCIGLALGAMLLQKGKKAKESKISGPSAEFYKKAGKCIAAAAAVFLAVSVVVLLATPVDTAKSALVTAILLVTAQYGAAMVLIFLISGMLHKDKKRRTEVEKKEDE